MSLYVDTSALLKRYVDEPESEACECLLLADPHWLTARHTYVEIRRNLGRLLEGRALEAASTAFEDDWRRIDVIELDQVTCELAARVALATGTRTLDALHLAAATRVGLGAIRFLSYDVRQARAAREMGWTVVGL